MKRVTDIFIFDKSTNGIRKGCATRNAVNVNVKVKVAGVVVPLLAMEAYRGVEVYIHSFLTSTLGGGELSAARPGPFWPGERSVIRTELKSNLAQQ